MMDMNVLYCGDNLELMRGMDDECVDLIYADPPYFTQKDWGDFDDRFDSMDEYIEFMRARLVEMHRLLKPTGSVYIHCDWHASHRIRCVMDDVFGSANFKNDIAWCYTMASNSKKSFPHKHDNIMFYTKSNKWNFDMDSIRIPYSESTINRAKYSGFGFGEEVYDLNPLGKPPEDWWCDISRLGRSKVEWTDYKTQKPIALLERIVRASSNEGDVVLDPFMGSGTTLVAAKSLGRKYIGIDLNPDAIEITQTRLDNTAYQQELDL